MSDVLIVSCRLCLEPDELTSMVTTARQLGSPLRTVEFSICRPCSRAIAGELQALDSDYNQGVSGDASIGASQSAERNTSEGVSEVHDPGVLTSEGEDVGQRESETLHNASDVSTPGASEPEKG